MAAVLFGREEKGEISKNVDKSEMLYVYPVWPCFVLETFLQLLPVEELKFLPFLSELLNSSLISHSLFFQDFGFVPKLLFCHRQSGNCAKLDPPFSSPPGVPKIISRNGRFSC